MKHAGCRAPRGPMRPWAIAAVLASWFLPAAPALGQSADERLFLLPAQVRTGPGTVRLDGMGGFETTVPDENLEISLWDFGGNPAGFPDDRDAWNLEFRYGHQEYAERDSRTAGTDVKINEGTIRGGFFRPGNLGAGAQLDYAEVSVRDFGNPTDEFRVVGLRGILGKYMGNSFSFGVTLGMDTESEDVFSRAIYNIEHDNSRLRGGLGAAYRIIPGVAVGARGEIISWQVDGTSEGNFHTDSFDWSRPGGLYSLHAFVDRGRLSGGVDYSRRELEGEEEVRISWSDRFIFNPTPEDVTREVGTLTEDRTNSQFRTRWRVDVVPRRIAVSLATQNGSEEFAVRANPNVIGSLGEQDVEATTSAIIAGVSWMGIAERLLLAGELKIASTEVTSAGEEGESVNQLDETLLRAGGEYFFGESVVGRAGLIHENQDFDFDSMPDLNGGFGTTRLAAGLGLMPAGGIWQFDFALDLVLDSDLDERRTGGSAYVRYLF